jgi:beta-lactamase superfamily II metal-dependent hydrolase
VQPALAISSARKGFASGRTLQELERAGARVFETAWDGAVSVEIAPGGVRWSTFLAR